MTAMQNATHVEGRSVRVSRETLYGRDANPTNRRSTIRMSPNTAVMAMTWIVSTTGNATGFVAMKVPTALAPMVSSNSFIDDPQSQIQV